ncbi:MAG: hypothetical protein ACLUE1_00595 [Adlercreutzia equolifaciens]
MAENIEMPQEVASTPCNRHLGAADREAHVRAGGCADAGAALLLHAVANQAPRPYPRGQRDRNTRRHRIKPIRGKGGKAPR